MSRKDRPSGKGGYVGFTSEAARRLGYQDLVELHAGLKAAGVEAQYKTVNVKKRMHKTVLIPVNTLKRELGDSVTAA